MKYSRQGLGLCPPQRTPSVANKEDVNVNEKIHPRPTEEISAPHAEEKYVLEDVFWVPLSNCRFRQSTSLVLPEPRSENHDNGKVSSPGEASCLAGLS
jgi:hypothetical protein